MTIRAEGNGESKKNTICTYAVTVAVAAVALPVMAPTPCAPLAVKYKLMAVLLGN